jgi:hypothetical protein
VGLLSVLVTILRSGEQTLVFSPKTIARNGMPTQVPGPKGLARESFARKGLMDWQPWPHKILLFQPESMKHF